MVCHKGFKTEQQCDRAAEYGGVCEDCGGDLRRPTGREYVDPSVP